MNEKINSFSEASGRRIALPLKPSQSSGGSDGRGPDVHRPGAALVRRHAARRGLAVRAGHPADGRRGRRGGGDHRSRRLERRSAELPERLRTRDWPSVVQVMLALDQRLGRAGGLEDRRGERGDPPRGGVPPVPRPGSSTGTPSSPTGRCCRPGCSSTTGTVSASSPSSCRWTTRPAPRPTPRRTPGRASMRCSPRWNSATPCSPTGTGPAGTSDRPWITAEGPPSSREPGSVTGRPPTSAGPGWTCTSTATTSNPARPGPRWATQSPA